MITSPTVLGTLGGGTIAYVYRNSLPPHSLLIVCSTELRLLRSWWAVVQASGYQELIPRRHLIARSTVGRTQCFSAVGRPCSRVDSGCKNYIALAVVAPLANSNTTVAYATLTRKTVRGAFMVNRWTRTDTQIPSFSLFRTQSG